MASTVIKNWDNKNWLSSKEYIRSINKFLISQIKLNTNSKILDIGCGRGKILGNLSSNLKLKNKPLGIDIIDHKDRDKRIKFKKVSGLSFFNSTVELLSISNTLPPFKIVFIELRTFSALGFKRKPSAFREGVSFDS